MLLVSGLTLIVPALLHSSKLYPLIGLSIIYAGITLTIDHCLRRPYRILNARPVVWLGVLSYSLYVWQQPFLYRASLSWWCAFPQNMVCALLVATLSYYSVEKPILEWAKGVRRSNKRADLKSLRPAGVLLKP